MAPFLAFGIAYRLARNMTIVHSMTIVQISIMTWALILLFGATVNHCTFPDGAGCIPLWEGPKNCGHPNRPPVLQQTACCAGVPRDPKGAGPAAGNVLVCENVEQRRTFGMGRQYFELFLKCRRMTLDCFKLLLDHM